MDFNEIAQFFAGSDVPHEIHFHDVHDNNIENYYAGGHEKDNNNRCDSIEFRNHVNSLNLSKKQQILFQKAISAGLMSRLPDGHYQWLSTKALLSYFCGRVFCGDRPMEGCDGRIVWEFGSGVFPKSAVAAMFQTKGIGDYRAHRGMMSVPHNHKIIDDLMI